LEDEIMRKIELIGAMFALAIATPVIAQGKGKGADGVPPGHRPPAGMCRIWIDGVPPGKQPAPTDCATAVSRRPANSRVIFGDETPFPGKGKSKDKDQRCADRTTGSTMGTILGIPIPTGSTVDRTLCRDDDDSDDDRVTGALSGGDRAASANRGKSTVAKQNVKKGKGGR
jgi:hypothetical protein